LRLLTKLILFPDQQSQTQVFNGPNQ